MQNDKEELEEIPCKDCLILPICIQRTIPKPELGFKCIFILLSPLIKKCDLFFKWFSNGPLLTHQQTSTDKALEFFLKYKKREKADKFFKEQDEKK